MQEINILVFIIGIYFRVLPSNSILRLSSTGYCLGQLWTDGPQMLHGCSSNPTGRAGPQHNGYRLVQAFPYLLHGGSNNGTAHPPFIPDVIGEHHWALLWAIIRLTQKCIVLMLRLSFHCFNQVQSFCKPCIAAPGSARQCCPWSR